MILQSVYLMIEDAARPQDLVDGFQKEEVAPHDGLVDAQLFVEMIDAVLQDPFPARGGPRQVAVGAERVENGQGGVAITLGPRRVALVDEAGEVPQARGGDGGGRAVVDAVRADRNVEVPGRYQASRTAGDEAVGVAAGDGKIGGSRPVYVNTVPNP